MKAFSATDSGVHERHPRGLRVVATIAAALFAAVALFQAGLALGAPWADLAWGGTGDGRLDTGRRIASGLAAAALTWMASVVLARAGAIRRSPVRQARLGGYTWAIAGLMALNTLGNLASSSPSEQRVFAPVTALLTALTVVLARRGGRGGTR